MTRNSKYKSIYFVSLFQNWSKNRKIRVLGSKIPGIHLARAVEAVGTSFLVKQLVTQQARRTPRASAAMAPSATMRTDFYVSEADEVRMNCLKSMCPDSEAD